METLAMITLWTILGGLLVWWAGLAVIITLGAWCAREDAHVEHDMNGTVPGRWRR